MADSAAVAGAAGALVALSVALLPGGILLVVQSMAALAFLQETNQEQFNLKLLTIEEEVGPRNIYEFRTITGEIEVERRRKATKFCD